MKIFKLVKKMYSLGTSIEFYNFGIQRRLHASYSFSTFWWKCSRFPFLAYTGKEASLTLSVRTPQTVISGSHCSTAV